MQHQALRGADVVRGGLCREFLHPVENGGDRADCAVGDLQDRVGLRCVTRSLPHRPAVGPQLVGDGESGRVVGRPVDPEA